MTTLFISDLHLQKERPEITRAFFQFLDKKASTATALYILGDFFEVWIGDDGMSEFEEEIVNALKNLSSHCQIFFIHGNRDFLIGSQFSDLANISILNEPSVISVAGKPCLILHGDSLCTEDVEYMKFRQMVRAPEWQSVFLAKPIEERRAS